MGNSPAENGEFACGKDGSSAIVQTVATSESAIRTHFAKQLATAAFRAEYYDTASPLGIRGAPKSSGAVCHGSAVRHGRELNGAPSSGARS
jgi:hypothetical protein